MRVVGPETFGGTKTAEIMLEVLAASHPKHQHTIRKKLSSHWNRFARGLRLIRKVEDHEIRENLFQLWYNDAKQAILSHGDWDIGVRQRYLACIRVLLHRARGV